MNRMNLHTKHTAAQHRTENTRIHNLYTSDPAIHYQLNSCLIMIYVSCRPKLFRKRLSQRLLQSSDLFTSARNLTIITDQVGRAQVWMTVGKHSCPSTKVIKASNSKLGEEVTYTRGSNPCKVAQRIILCTDKNGLVTLRRQLGNVEGLISIKTQALKFEPFLPIKMTCSQRRICPDSYQKNSICLSAPVTDSLAFATRH